ncbi:MAG: exodeoxyribonuclease VII small subunit [Bacilli bacterium]
MDKKAKFEDNLNELEKIVSSLESGEVDLDTAIKEYTKAMELAKECSNKLNSAKEKVNKILTENGTLENFDVE